MTERISFQPVCSSKSNICVIYILVRSKACTILAEFHSFFATKSPNVSRFMAELFKVSPLSPKSDQHQISPCNINAL